MFHDVASWNCTSPSAIHRGLYAGSIEDHNPGRKRIYVIIASRDALFRESLCVLFGTKADFEVSGVAHEESACLQLASEKYADVLLLDWKMACANEMKFIKEFTAAKPTVRPVLLAATMNCVELCGRNKTRREGDLLHRSERRWPL